MSLPLLDSLPAQEALLKNVVSFVPGCGHLANAAAIAIGPDLSAKHKVFLKAMNVAAITRDLQSHSRVSKFIHLHWINETAEEEEKIQILSSSCSSNIQCN